MTALETEVERVKARMEARGEPAADANIVAFPKPIGVEVAAIMPEVLAVMERAHEQWAAFCDSVRPQFVELKPRACKTHPLIERQPAFEETCQETRLRGEFTARFSPCPECATGEARAAQRRFWARRGVPERVVDATLSNFIADTEAKTEALRRVCEWNKRDGVFLLLHGTTGTGKGHLAVGCMKIHGAGTFITHADMLTDLRASYTLHTTKTLIEQWQAAEVFVLDEFGLSPGGKDEDPMLYQVLADRYDKRRPTIITSNLDLPKLRETLGYRLLDRISEDCVSVRMSWSSHRKPAAP